MHQDIINKLKANKRPFGLMEPELQEAAKEIGREEFEVLCSSLKWDKNVTWGWESNPHSVFRLRPDYEPEPEVEPEIIKQEIIYENGGRSRFGTGGHSIDYAVGHPRFIAFRFEGGEISGTPFLYRVSSNSVLSVYVPAGCSYVVHRATHVLFSK